MAAVQCPKKVPKAAVKKKKPSQASKNYKKTYCILCRRHYYISDAQDHMHGLQHHRTLQTVLGKDAVHECQACKLKLLGLNEFANHILTTQHITSFKNLRTKNVKPFSLFRSLGTEAVTRILKRNRELKKEAKKTKNKQTKKLKQEAGQRRMKMQLCVAKEKTLASQGATQSKCTQKQWKTSQQSHNAHGSGVVQNKENKISSVQGPHGYRGEAFHNASWRPNYPHHCQNQSAPAHHLRFHSSFGNNQFRFGNSQNYSFNVPTPNASHAVSQHNYATQNAFTSNHLPDSGASLFGSNQSANMELSQPEDPSCPAQPASANTPAGAAPIRVKDISFTLKQIRRELGMREPCRADREARKQTSETGGGADGSGAPQMEAEQSAGTPAAPSRAAPGKSNQASCKKTQGSSQIFKKSSAARTDRLNGKEGESLGAKDTSSSLKSPAFEPNLSLTHKVRFAHKAAQEDKWTPHKPVLNKLLNLSGARSNLNLTEMYREKKRKNLKDKFKTDLINLLTENDSTSPSKDLSPSEGFHWESVSGASSVPPVSLPPAVPTPTVPRVQDPAKNPGAARAPSSNQPVEKVVVKSEPNVENKTGRLMDEEIGAGKRKRRKTAGDVASSQETNKTKDPSRMDQLLAVSLKEEELSRSLQELDGSLIEARNALHAAYAEVQRLLLLRQQFSAEINSLRAKRIEILQNLQEGYSEASEPSSSIAHPPPAPLTMPAAALKRDVSHFATNEQAFPKAADAPQVPLNQPGPSFSPNMLPAMLLQPSQLFPSTVSFVQQIAAKSSASATSPAPTSSTSRQQEQEARVGPKGCAQTEAVAKTPQPSESESAAEPAGNLSKARVKVKEPAVIKGEKRAGDENDEGSESDSSVEVIGSSNLEVINIDESDSESSADSESDVQPEAPHRSVSMEVSSASTQTSQQNEPESKFQPSSDSSKNASPDRVEEEPALGFFSSHSGSVHGLQVHDGLLYTCSADNTARAYSLTTRECEAIFYGHTNKINCLLVSLGRNTPARLYTGSSDETICCHNITSKKCLQKLSLPDRVLCLHTAWSILYAGLANGSVISYSVKNLKRLDVFECHGPRGVSCLGTAQEGARRLLLVGSYDSTISVRDAKNGLLLRSLEGHTKTVLCMKVVNDLVFSGSSDTSVHAHNIHTGELVRIYKGHGHAVTSIVILGKVMVTACLDKLVRVYELQSHDRLQVYGGHSDMVMCMAVHKSVIYTGCYDGTVQAVKLNLMKNYRCWWQGCSLIFGITEHLLRHLTEDHTNSNLQTTKCRWKDCNTFFTTHQAVRQELPVHMQGHVENDSIPQP